MTTGRLPGEPGATLRAFIDLHCHTAASFDSLARPRDVVRAAAARGLTHLAVTDHDRIDGALAARDAAPPGISVLVGQEVRTTGGDLIAVFLERPIAPGLTPAEAIAAAREQGALVGIPHPFDRLRGSLGRAGAADGSGLDALAPLVDWVEVHNARLVGPGNERAAAFAAAHGLPGVAVSDAHTVLEVAVAYTAIDVAGGALDTADRLRAALAAALELVPGRASLLVRLWTPFAKLAQAARGNGRLRPGAGAGSSGGVGPAAGGDAAR